MSFFVWRHQAVALAVVFAAVTAVTVVAASVVMASVDVGYGADCADRADCAGRAAHGAKCPPAYERIGLSRQRAFASPSTGCHTFGERFAHRRNSLMPVRCQQAQWG